MEKLGKYDEAEHVLRRVLAMHESSHGPSHPRVASDLNNLASILQATNRGAEAETLLSCAIAILEASFGPHHPELIPALNNMVGLLRATDRLLLAEPMMRRVLGIALSFRRSTGEPHPHFREALLNYEGVLRAMGQNAEQIQARLDEIGRSAGVSLSDLIAKHAG